MYSHNHTSMSWHLMVIDRYSDTEHVLAVLVNGLDQLKETVTVVLQGGAGVKISILTRNS